MLKVAHNKNKKTTEQYPNEAETVKLDQRELPEDNHFKNHSREEIRKKYIQWMVISEYMNNILDLPQNSTFQQLGNRAYQLFQANKETDKPETAEEA